MVNVVNSRLDEHAPAEVYDDALRWLIPSRTDPNVSYVVELNEAPGYDVCNCMHFQTKLGPLLARGISPETAVAEGLVKLKKDERVEDALKCFHIRDANYRYGVACKRVMCRARRVADRAAKQNHVSYASTPNTTQEDREPQTFTPPPRFQTSRG